MGIAYLGIGFGGMLVPQIAKQLNMQFDWHITLMILGLLMICIAFPMIWFVKDNPATFDEAVKTEITKIPISQIIKKWPFYFLLIGSMCSIGAVSGTGQNLKLFLSIDLKYTQQESANILSMVLGASILGRLLMGWLADKIQKKYVMMLIYILIAGSIPLLYLASTPGIIYLFAFIFGIGLGGDYMIIPLMAAELFGVRVMGRVMGIILTFDGLAEAFSPMLVGWLRDRGGSYTNGFSALIILGIIGIVTVACLPGRKKQLQHSN